MKALLLSALLLGPLGALAADEAFTDARVLDVQAKQGLSNGLFGGGVEADNYTEITVQLGELKISARSYPLGGGVIYLSQHPEAVVIGSTVKARLAARGVLEVLVGEKKKLKFDVQRMERVAADRP